MNIIKSTIFRCINKVINTFFIIIDRVIFNGLSVYVFHNIVNNEKHIDGFTVDKNIFEKFIIHLLKIECKPKSIHDILNIQKNNYIYDAFIITFDDAFRGVYKYAYPILKKYNIPFIVFVSTSLIDKDGYLSEKEIKIMSKDSICTIASHGKDHIYYRELNEDDLYNQYNYSKRYLEKLTGKEIFAFAFPFGSYYACSYKNIRILQKTTYKIGFSTIPSKVIMKKLTSKYFVPRITMSNYRILSLIS